MIHDIHNVGLQCSICSLRLIQHSLNPKPSPFELICQTIPHFGCENSTCSLLILFHFHRILSHQLHPPAPSSRLNLVYPFPVLTLMQLLEMVDKLVISIKLSPTNPTTIRFIWLDDTLVL
ncbi:hypothetical protein V8G54_020787 [Vigna mungo]|uniref:Uncharacterized protein n=1 Tax=Vigna mungo TaxID=3915 RepID=A0AAQ3RX35_VIGMU